MSTFKDKAHLRTFVSGFLAQESSGTENQTFAGSGVVMAYTLSDPDLRIVLDGSVAPQPGKAFGVHIDDPKAPEPAIEFFLSADTYDELYTGNAQPMALMMSGKVKSKGDVAIAMRLLPAMARAIPHYKKYREEHL